MMLAGSRWKGVARTTSVRTSTPLLSNRRRFIYCVGGAHAHMTSVTARTISGEAFSPFLLFLGSQNMRVTFYHSQKAEGKVMIENFQCALPQNFSI